MRKTISGFTIVELLIVIVVISILATITVVAYGGIQKRAHDSAIKDDLHKVVTVIESYKQQVGNYPYDPVAATDANTLSGALQTQLNMLDMKASVNSYSRASSNGLYIAKTDGTVWAFLAIPKDGSAYYVSSTNTDAKPYTTPYPNCFPGCDARHVGNFFGIPTEEVAFNYVFTSSGGARFWN